MRFVKLGDVLTEEQIKHVMALRRENPDLHEFIERLKEYFATISQQLMKQGLLADYAAYMVAGLFLRAEEKHSNNGNKR